jgi:predicted O-methyltransferase YrrM
MSNVLYPTQLKYIESFLPESKPILAELEEYAAINKVPILNKTSALFLEQMIQISKPENVLEIGAAIGYSSIRIAEKLPENGVLVTIEKSKPNYVIAKSNFAKANVEDKVTIVFSDALEAIPILKMKFDFIFLDADKEDYKNLFDLSLLSLNKGGIIFIDNLLWYGYAAEQDIPKKYENSARHIKEFNDYFMNHKSLTTSLIPIGDGIGLGIKNE